MSIQRIIGLVLLVGGIILIILGFTASRSLADQVNNFFSGRFTKTTMFYLIGGIAMVVVGLVLVFRNFGRK